jgi:hypothetical protein
MAYRLQGHRPRQVALDAVLLAAVPVLLAVVHHGVPLGVRRDLAFDHAAPAAHAYLTSAYVHADAAHLHGNLIGYGLVATYAYLLCLQAGRRRWFHATYAAFLLVLPVFVNLVDAAAFAVLFGGVGLVSQGFSGVAAGFGGFLVVALVAYLRDAYGHGVGVGVGQAAVLLLLLQVDTTYAGRVRPVTAGLALAGIALVAGWYAREHDLSVPAGSVARRRLAVDAFEVAVVVGVLWLQIAMLFPADPVSDGAFVGVIAHAAGFVLGLVGARAVAAGQGAVGGTGPAVGDGG